MDIVMKKLVAVRKEKASKQHEDGKKELLRATAAGELSSGEAAVLMRELDEAYQHVSAELDGAEGGMNCALQGSAH